MKTLEQIQEENRKFIIMSNNLIEKKTEIIKLQSLNFKNIQYFKNIQSRVFDQSNDHVINYLVNFFCYDRERMIAGFSRLKNNYRVFLRFDDYFDENPRLYAREFERKEFTSFKLATDYLAKIIDQYQIPEKSKIVNIL